MAPLSYDSMRNLILDNISLLRDVAVFTPELLTAIFWEETNFQNIKQMGGGPAVGFGQVERDTIKMVNKAFNMNFTPDGILGDDNLSVQIASYTLSLLLRGTRSKMGALNGYAGASANPANAAIPGHWLRCESLLVAVHASDQIPGSTAVYERLTYSASATAIKAALKVAKPDSNPELAFPSARAIAI
jgi:hypothetical protein